MDSQQFRLPTYPDFTPRTNVAKVKYIVKQRVTPSIKTAPIDDSRYSGYLAPMEDGRLITDYRTHCANNFGAPQYGNSTRSWMQHNADGIIQVSRKRQADQAGAQYYKAPTVPPAQMLVACDEYQCEFASNPDRMAIGLIRNEELPPLFGTFSEPHKPAPIPTGISLTRTFEGGRNSPRGRDFHPLGHGLVNYGMASSG